MDVGQESEQGQILLGVSDTHGGKARQICLWLCHNLESGPEDL
jgi:hypothetical protein